MIRNERSGREKNMKMQNIGNVPHFIKLRKLAKPLVISISALLIVSMILTFAATGVKGAPQHSHCILLGDRYSTLTATQFT